MMQDSQRKRLTKSFALSSLFFCLHLIQIGFIFTRVDSISINQNASCINLLRGAILITKKMKIAIKSSSTIKIYSGGISYQALSLFISKEFQLSPSKYTLTYVDDEGDNITLASNEDLTSAFELNSDKLLLKVRLNLNQEDQKIQFEVISEPPAMEQPLKAESLKEEKHQGEHQRQQVHEGRWKKWGCWGRKSHHKSSSESSHEGHHGKGHFRKFHHMLNMTIAEKVDERIRTMLPCLKAQLAGGHFIKTFSVVSNLVHEHTECKSCLSAPIVGARFKCLECPAFSLCQNCEPLVEHEHNLLKIKHIVQESSNQEFPFKFFKKFWKHGGHSRSHSSSAGKCGREEGTTRKLAKIFGGASSAYSEFANANTSLNKFQLINKYATQNGKEEQLVKFRCQKIAKRLNKQPEEFKEVVAANMNMRPWELVHKLIQNSSEHPTQGGRCGKYQRKCQKAERKWQKEERKCRKSQEETEKSGKQCHQMPSCEQKASGLKLSCGSSERTEKGKILETLIGLFGGKNVKEYFGLIEQHFSMGEEAIINKWLESHCSPPSA